MAVRETKVDQAGGVGRRSDQRARAHGHPDERVVGRIVPKLVAAIVRHDQVARDLAPHAQALHSSARHSPATVSRRPEAAATWPGYDRVFVNISGPMEHATHAVRAHQQCCNGAYRRCEEAHRMKLVADGVADPCRGR